MSSEAREQAQKKDQEMLALRELRQARKMTQSMLAVLLHISQPSAAKMERTTGKYIPTLPSHIPTWG